MRFYRIEWRDPLPDDIEFPCVVLEANNWNDYGYYTTYNFKYYGEDRNCLIWRKAGVKILQKDQFTTEIPKYFEKLNHNYCSLGQALGYYSNLRSLGQSTYRAILTALRDVVYSSNVVDV